MCHFPAAVKREASVETGDTIAFLYGTHIAAASQGGLHGAFVVAGYIGHPNAVASAGRSLLGCLGLKLPLDLRQRVTTLCAGKVRGPQIFIRDLLVTHRHLLVGSDESADGAGSLISDHRHLLSQWIQ